MKQTKNTLTIGALGEEIACRYLVGQKFDLLERNFRQRCGEIDIIAEKWGILHFIEVKTVSREKAGYRAEDNIHFRKIQRIERTIQVYLLKRNVPHETRFQIDGVTVYLDPSSRQAGVKMIENINL
ncbi:MAG: YraN family protein [Candidatus Paceibacterota bacterium]